MTGQPDRDELVELMSRYANMPDSQDWDELPRSVFCDEFTCDFGSLGAPVTTFSRDDWCQRMKQVFAGWTATHHAITNHRIAIDGDRATIRAHVRAEHWAPPDVAAGGPNCWLVVGFYDDVAVRTPDGWRLISVKLTVTHQENEALLAGSMAAVKDDLESRVRRLEDRALISETVTKYAVAVDRCDWEMFAHCFTDHLHADYSENGLPAADFARDELVAIVRDAVSGYTATQHLSPNHVIDFDDHDPDRAVCTSYMYAQHHVDASENSEFLLLRGSYTNHMVRTADGWRIERLIQHISWRDDHES